VLKISFTKYLLKEKKKESMEIESLPYTATSLSVLGRIIFMYLLWKNKSKNMYSFVFCLLGIGSSGMWIYYSIKTEQTPMLVRSISEILLLSMSAGYIIKNKYNELRQV
jgi:hypothetical protein